MCHAKRIFSLIEDHKFILTTEDLACALKSVEDNDLDKDDDDKDKDTTFMFMYN